MPSTFEVRRHAPKREARFDLVSLTPFFLAEPPWPGRGLSGPRRRPDTQYKNSKKPRGARASRAGVGESIQSSRKSGAGCDFSNVRSSQRIERNHFTLLLPMYITMFNMSTYYIPLYAVSSSPIMLVVDSR